MLSTNNAPRLAFALTTALTATLLLNACGGGGATPNPSNPGLGIPQSITTSVPFTSVGAAIALPSLAGYTETITLPANNAPAGTKLSLTLSTKLPAGTSPVPTSFKMTQPFLFFTLSSAATVTLHGFPAFSLTLPQTLRWDGGPLHLGYYNPSVGWKHVGDLTVTGSTLTFAGNNTALTLRANVKYVALPFACVVTHIYSTNSDNTITVYDEDGNQLTTTGTFPNLNHPSTITFDSNNHQLYVVNSNVITAYDEQGNQVPTAATFFGGPGIAFDSNNHHLYALTGSSSPGAIVYDEQGNQVTVTGTFPNTAEPSAVVFNPNNNHLFVLNTTLTPVTVYDEQGNQIPFATIATPCGMDSDITFDSHNRHFYLTQLGAPCGPFPTIVVFDELGNQITTTGTFPNAGGGVGITFDSNNNRLYVKAADGSTVNVYDEDGNQITTSGTFPHVSGFGIVAAPQ